MSWEQLLMLYVSSAVAACDTRVQACHTPIYYREILRSAVFWGSTYAIRGFQQLTFAIRGFQQLSFPNVAFAPKYYARCGFRSYTG